MEKESKCKVTIMKDLLKLPVDEETSTVKAGHLFKLIEKIASTIPEADSEELMQEDTQQE